MRFAPANRMKIVVKYGIVPAAGIELLADSSILPSGRPLFIPDWAASFTATLSVAARINRLGKCVTTRFAHRYWDAITGCMLTQGIDKRGNAIARHALTRAHDNALVLGQMIPKEEILDDAADLVCMVDNQPVAQVTLPGMTTLINDTICHLSQYMTLKMGDLLCVSSGCTLPLDLNTTTELALNGQQVLQTKIK